MPLKLTVGLAKKIGQPDYGSLGASCSLEIELESSLIQSAPDTLQRHVQNAFVACRQAVQDELSREQQTASSGEHQRTNGNGRHHPNGSTRSANRQATS